MTTKQLIAAGIDGGWKEYSKYGCKSCKIRKYKTCYCMEKSVFEIFMDPKFWQAAGKSLGWEGEKIRMCVGCGIALKNSEEPTMDGKHGGRNGCGSDIYEYDGQWLIEMHRMIDALAEGKSISEFIKTL